MQITRLYASPDGASHFADRDIPLHDGGPIGALSETHPAAHVVFRETAPDYDYDWHCAPARQYIVLLDGAIEIEVSSGETRRFQGGDVLLVEDTFGRGHRTRALNDAPRRSLFIVLPDDAPGAPIDHVQEADEESFPASDAPAWTGTAVT